LGEKYENVNRKEEKQEKKAKKMKMKSNMVKYTQLLLESIFPPMKG
jgi:hypothetical protein